MRGGKARGSDRAAARLVYEDELVLAYDKPAGLPVIAPDGSRSRCLLDVASDQVRRSNPKGRAAVVHRIDRDTSGVVVFARNAAAKRLLMSGWDEIVAERLYVALVEGSMGSDEGLLDSYLVEDARGFVRAARPGERGAKRAVSRWRLVAEGGGASLVELRLETGRKHQIRAQLAGIGHPVVGDGRYGRRWPQAGTRVGERARPERLCLHAAVIELRLPGQSSAIRIESPVPPEFAAALGRETPRPAPTRSMSRDGDASDERLGPSAASRRGAVQGPGKRPKAPRAAGHESRRDARPNAPRGASSASRSASRSAAPRGRLAPRPKKPSSRP